MSHSRFLAESRCRDRRRANSCHLTPFYPRPACTVQGQTPPPGRPWSRSPHRPGLAHPWDTWLSISGHLGGPRGAVSPVLTGAGQSCSVLQGCGSFHSKCPFGAPKSNQRIKEKLQARPFVWTGTPHLLSAPLMQVQPPWGHVCSLHKLQTRGLLGPWRRRCP